MLRIAIFKQEDMILTAVIDAADDRTVEIRADREHIPGTALGDIVTARIDRIEQGLGAVFVSLPGDEKGYLPLSELGQAFFTRRGSSLKYCQGDELLVQVRQESLKGKAITVTTELSLTDTLVVAGCRGFAQSNPCGDQTRLSVSETPNARGKPARPSTPAGSRSPEIRVSKKLTAPERNALRELMGEAQFPDAGCRRWILLRTAAAALLEEEDGPERLLGQAGSALETLEGIIARAPFLSAGTVHRKAPEPFLARIRNFPADQVEKVITDDAQLYAQLEESLGASYRLEFYDDRMVSLYSLYRMRWRMDEATGRIAHLRSGGNLIIEPTQAMTVIDVNTGKTVMKKQADREEELLKANLEAARECARQIRLRNLSGIIMVDFINMREKEHNRRLMEELRRLLAADPVETKAVDMTKLGLVEITRKKTEKPLHESMRGFSDCGAGD